MRRMATFALSQVSCRLRTVIGGEKFETVGNEGGGPALGKDCVLKFFPE